MENIIVLASNNKNKLNEIKAELNTFGIEVISQKEAVGEIEVEETGTTFKENAILKAEAIYNIVKKPVIADDSGLCVDYLNGEPGVYSNRFAGPDATDDDRIFRIIELLKNAPDDKRTASFICDICFIDELGEKHIFEGKCDGMIAKEKHGDNGFGYDPIFMVGEKSFAEISKEEKNMISHRGMAIKKLVDYLKNTKNTIEK